MCTVLSERRLDADGKGKRPGFLPEGGWFKWFAGAVAYGKRSEKRTTASSVRPLARRPG